VATARAAQVEGLGAVEHRLAVAALLHRAALAQAQAGRVAGLQQINHPRLESLGRSRRRGFIERSQPFERRRTGFRILAFLPRRCILQPDVRCLFEGKQYGDHVLAVLAHGAQAGIIDVDDRPACIQFQPEIDFIGLLARALDLGLDMDFAGSPPDALDSHPPLGGIAASALPGRRIEPAVRVAQEFGTGKQIGGHAAVKVLKRGGRRP
jgi:hypothetical protein